MQKKFLLFILFFLSFCFSILAQSTSIQGKVTDKENGETIIGASVILFKNGVQNGAMVTDIDGNYNIKADPGSYDIEVSYVGYQPQRITKVLLSAGKANKLDVKLETSNLLDEVKIIAYKVPLIEQDNTTSGQIITSEQIRTLPTRDINQIASLTPGVSSADANGSSAPKVKGSRGDATNYFIDDIRIYGVLPPQLDIEQLQVITGGIEAQYGDVTGGIISVTTKGPASKFSGAAEVESSQYLDAFGNNLVNVNLSGPILRSKDKKKSILGFRVAGQFRNRLDNNPTATGVYKVLDSKIAELEANPVSLFNGTRGPSAELLLANDAELLKARVNNGDTRYDFTGKLDARFTDKMLLSLSGSFYNNQARFAGDNVGWALLNSSNNPYRDNNNYRTNLRFRHKIGSGDEKSALIRNASYTIVGGYEKSFGHTYDARHGDNLFNYGYIGQFDYDWEPVIGQIDDPNVKAAEVNVGGRVIRLGFNDYRQVFKGFTAGTVNPILAAYNAGLDATSDAAYAARNGFISGVIGTPWSLYKNVGSIYNTNSKSENDIYTFQVKSDFDIVPKSSDKGVHNIQLGLMYEQRENRSYTINPQRLWEIARQQANVHILGADYNTIVDPNYPLPTPILGITSAPLYGLLINNNLPDASFYKNIRTATGTPINSYLNVDALKPEQFNLNMFSARELTDPNLVSYYGYDYTGNKMKNVSFDDFFTARDANGVRTLPVAAFKPIYQAAWIQDKFTFKDIILRLGLRLDRYDANTKVMKDPFSLYEVIDAKSFYDNVAKRTKPTGVEDDYLVYIDRPGSTNVKGFRKGSQWYNVQGTAVNDANLLFGNSPVYAYFKDTTKITNPNFNPAFAFQDYVPQVNLMPRLAFSFPISDEANFFANYDILVSRPTTNVLATPLDYFYFDVAQRVDEINNPNLKPERTIYYEVGFKQKVTESSAITLTAYYKELRNLIQTRLYNYVPTIGRYVTYDNQDFGSVKGFTFSYDLRKTQNFSLLAAYTLQFAEGTGSNPNSQRAINNTGNLRVLFPLDFDERHNVQLTADYRYGEGKEYNGPRWFGKDIFSSTGLNLQVSNVSGEPYTATRQPTRFGGSGTLGGINGSRLPWKFRMDLRLDKTIELSKNPEKPMDVNIFFRVQNVLNTRNIIGVYSATGSPSDDGFLLSPDGEGSVQNIVTSGQNLDAYLAAYRWRLLTPGFYTPPRRLFVGATFYF